MVHKRVIPSRLSTRRAALASTLSYGCYITPTPRKSTEPAFASNCGGHGEETSRKRCKLPALQNRTLNR
jgi:hypothetical protein